MRAKQFGHRVIPLIALMCLGVEFACAQAKPLGKLGKLEFDVASVKRNKSDDKPRSNFSLDSGNLYSTVEREDVFTPRGGRFSGTNLPLWEYIVFAFNPAGTQELALRFSFFAGLSSKVPAWVNDERFDIEASAEGNPTKDQMRGMMQSLLAERFRLVVHTETRVVPVLALVLAVPGKIGPQLQPHDAADSCFNGVARAELPPVCGVLAHLPPSGPGRLRFGGRGISLKLLANSLPTQTGMNTLSRPVVDATGLTGTFDLSLEWTPENNGDTGEMSGPTFQDALKNQLGLKLSGRKGPVELLVIDGIDQPSAN